MPVKAGWLKYLLKHRRSVFLRQVFRMARFHRTPFGTLLENILGVTEDFRAGFTFPTVASTALRRPELMRLIVSSHNEIASHGFKHVNYRYLSLDAQRRDIEKSLLTFRNLRIPIRGFRAPYNMYAEQTARLLEEFSFFWDGGLGYSPAYRERKSFFRVQVEDRKSRFVCIPLSKWSDDSMIDKYGLDSRQMARLLKGAIKQAGEKHGVVMFDLHPIRIGQPSYIHVLREVLRFGVELDGWFPTVTEAVDHWLRRREWKDGASFCCLLSGDIDNFDFSDYISRLF